MRWILMRIGSLALAAMWLYSGWAKLREPWLQFVVSINEFKILPDSALEPMARTLPWCEVALGLALVIPILTRWSSFVSTVVLTIFFAAGVSAYARGLSVDCGCFGSGGDPIGPKWFAEHGALILGSLAVTALAFIDHRARRQTGFHKAPPVPEIA